jgi:large conductance mechanosensitive channel
VKPERQASVIPPGGRIRRPARPHVKASKELDTMNGFRAFLSRGNVIDLAVAVVVGAAFTAVVNSLVKDLITPLIAALAGKADFSRLGFTINRSHFAVGDFINALVTFLLDALVIYYIIVVPLRIAMERFEKPGAVLAQKSCPECLSEIPQDARRCKYCTAVVVRAAAP